MSLRNRIRQLEKDSGAHDVYKYMCVIMEGWAAGWDAPEEIAKGYKIQPLIESAGGTGGEPFYLATPAELDAFGARPDVHLSIIKVGFADEQPNES